MTNEDRVMLSLEAAHDQDLAKLEAHIDLMLADTESESVTRISAALSGEVAPEDLSPEVWATVRWAGLIAFNGAILRRYHAHRAAAREATN